MWPALIALALAAIPAGALAYLYRRPLPRLDGTLRAPGLNEPVEVIRDRWGVPHIYAQGLDDLFFAQGYVHAQDRLWQMELNRRLGHGRLAEAFGEVGYATDRLITTIGLGRAARASLAACDPETRRTLDAYARGVNSCVAAIGHRLPLEFTLLGLKPEPWQPVDSLAYAGMMAWSLSYNWDAEVLHAAFVGKLGAERAAKLEADYPRDNPVALPDQTYADLLGPLLEEFRAAERWLPAAGARGASNNWVVDGAKSATGQPLLANDPHLGLQMPSVWYENHLAAPGFEVTGVSLAGSPGVVIGHNSEIAWGLTASIPDTQDLYLEKLNPSDRTQYEYMGTWEQATVEREEIRVKGEAAPRVVEVIITRHGPIVDELFSAAAGRAPAALAMRWVGHEPNRTPAAMLRLNRASNWDEFREALREWDAPSQSLVYADRAGNIGFYMPGKVPIRSRGVGGVPVPGWDGEHEWVGYIPHDELPHALNPAQHYLATANNRLVGEEYPHFLATQSMNGFRARRIVELLTAQERLSTDDFARIQVDLYCAPARSFRDLLVSLAPGILGQPSLAGSRAEAARALETLRTWNCNLTADSVAGAIYELTQHFAMRRVFGPWLGGLVDHYIGVGFHPLLAPTTAAYMDASLLVIQRVLTEDERDWFKDEAGEPLTRECILALALSDALGYLGRALGEDVNGWQWGRLHRAEFAHPLGAKRPLDRIFNRGPYPLGGDTNTVWQAAFVPKLPIQTTAFTASWRQIVDLGDWDASRAVHTTGQSGHPASKHYADMIPLWLKGEYHPMLWSRERVEANAETRLRLEP